MELRQKGKQTKEIINLGGTSNNTLEPLSVTVALYPVDGDEFTGNKLKYYISTGIETISVVIDNPFRGLSIGGATSSPTQLQGENPALLLREYQIGKSGKIPDPNNIMLIFRLETK